MENSCKSPNHSEKLIKELGMNPLVDQNGKGESGFISYISTSDIVVNQISPKLPKKEGDNLKANSSIYYLLNKERPINYLHWLSPDDTHILLDGGPVHYYVFHEEKGKFFSRQHLVGRDILKGERPVLMIPGGSWKALVLPVDVEFALLSTILTPEWTDAKDRLQVGAGEKFIDNYQNTSGWATPDFLLKLIGPNFKQPKG